MSSRRGAEHELFPRSDQVFLHIAAVFMVWLFLWRFVSAERLVQGAMVAAALCGAWIVIAVGRRYPWGQARGRWLQPIALSYTPLYFATWGFGLDAANRILVASAFGLAACTFVRGLKAGRLQLLGVWPRR
jgi:hypothetical protein